MSDALYRSGFEFDKRLDASLYVIYELNECYAVAIFENYVTSIDSKLTALEDAILNKDIAQIDLLAHAHISTYNYVGLSHIAGMMREIRHQAKTDDWSHVKYLIEQARSQTESMAPLMNQELERLRLFAKSRDL
ncbi:hypothetical protein [Chitinophaga qingshengii]|uniref:HPt domain-containing protein n=1 Tax=Chitinophaga qingshengii TaxID=1569794 RepID=A0ABR7TM37_9BACT|nr:hypothetical protein [Chitinophaga qingshengii]MBC9930552.1 hypothetical protein [Chitinophaga qingshengii]